MFQTTNEEALLAARKFRRGIYLKGSSNPVHWGSQVNNNGLSRMAGSNIRASVHID